MSRQLVTTITFAALLGIGLSLRAAEQPDAAQQEDAFRLPPEKRPPSWVVVEAGDLGALFNRKADGVELLSLLDRAKHGQLLAKASLPLFTITMRPLKSKTDVQLRADTGWQRVQVVAAATADTIEMRWESPHDKRLGPMRVTAVASIDRTAGAIRWKLRVDNVDRAWCVRNVVFPQVALDATSPQFEFFYPCGPGQVRRGWAALPSMRMGCLTYPDMYNTMPFVAAYDVAGGQGLYCAIHDPSAGVKIIRTQCRAEDHALVVAYEVPADNMDVGGNGFSTTGQPVWRLLHGDWFDAAMIYRAWVRREAPWYPKLGADGRTDTPLWMKELPLWVGAGGEPKDVLVIVDQFAKTLGVDVPFGVHWYVWHQNPFDNDYPHYFPPKPGFREALRTLEARKIYAMPYINGLLWDTRDKGAEDFQFTKLALPSTSKNEEGQPNTGTYLSKEPDGSPAKLAFMCPSTKLWHTTIRETVLRLMNEYGAKAVYLDMVAACLPIGCFDHSHGHPTGEGGSWWIASLNEMLGEIRRQKPADCVLTTECNAEPYVKSFDGYLDWHWGVDGQVPAFPAVYGRAIQMFGRGYQGPAPQEELAFRMRVGQQLVFGEQIGWFPADMCVKNPQMMSYLRQALAVRWPLRRYFYAGEMGRPPKLDGPMPTVTADWKWKKPDGRVTTDAVLTGAWMLRPEGRGILVFANVSDQPVTARLRFDASAYGLVGRQVQVKKIGVGEQEPAFLSPTVIQREITFPARSAFAWELSALSK
jgi:hypothetical protein